MKPNILITGTPGTGKSTLAETVAERTGLTHINVGEVAREGNYYEEWDEANHCHILDEDALLDDLEERLSPGGQIVDYHACELFPERWFQAVFVLRTDNSLLHKRLTSRGYPANKVADNIHCEIVQVILDEARESYPTEIVHELPSNSTEDLDSNADQIVAWLEQQTSS